MTTNQSFDSIDASFAAFQSLLGDLPSFQDTLNTEADARLKIINDILATVLGWRKSDILTEDSTGSGFLDYKLSINNVAKVIVEAKRAEHSFDLGIRACGNSYKLSGPVFKNAHLQEGINQAIRYSAYNGAELSCVTNGFEWVVFRSNRFSDGIDTLDGKAFVFYSLECVKDRFKDFFSLLSKDNVSRLTFRGLFQEAEGRIIRHSNFRKPFRMHDGAVFLDQPKVVSDLDRLMASFFQRLSDENDREMIEHCFVETKESMAAEHRLLRLAESIVGHIVALDTRSGLQLTNIIDRAKAANTNQFVLIVGTKGSGKTTFIHRFFNSKLPVNLRKSCIPIFLNLSDSDGDESTIIEWLKRKLLIQAEQALGDNRDPTWNELIGHMFFSEYKRWTTGTMSHLYKKDKDEFKIQFGKHIESIRHNDPFEYIRGLLRNFVNSRKQVPCLIFDNADHFSIDFQEKVFQFARSLFEQELCVVIMPITDKTSWQLSRQGALQSFESEVLLLPTPSAKQVLEKRIQFVLKKIEGDDLRESGSYFVGKGIRVDVANLVKFVRALQGIFLNSRRTAYLLGQLANHNVREVLGLTRDVVNSPHVGLDEAFKAYVVGTAMFIQDFKIYRALIRGRFDIHVSSANKFVHNIFNLNAELDTSPLLGLRILQTLKDAIIHSGDTKNRYMAKNDLFSYLMGMGFEQRAIVLWLDALLKAALVINYDPTCLDGTMATKIEISPAGELHLFWGVGNYNYLEAMAEVTPLNNEDSYEAMVSASIQYGQRRMHLIISLFVEYLIREDRIYCQVPDHESYLGQKNILMRLSSAVRSEPHPAQRSQGCETA